jgi:hypothetical protein
MQVKRRRIRTYTLIDSKKVFTISLVVAALTILGVYFWGLGIHRTFFENSILSTTILSIAFCSFITIGLYKGVKMKDSIGNVTDRLEAFKVYDLTPDFVPSDMDDIDVGEGIAGFLLSILLWILFAVVLAFTLWFFGNILVMVLVTFAAMLYWIFFRALRLVFKNSSKSKGDIFESIKFGVTYTFLYNFWIYGIFVLTEYLKA